MRTNTGLLANKAKYIAAIAKAYGHPADLIDIKLKPGSTTDIIVTFRLQEASHEENLLNTMKDEDSSLHNNLNTELAAQGTGVKVGANGVAHGAITELAGKPLYKCGQYSRVDKV